MHDAMDREDDLKTLAGSMAIAVFVEECLPSGNPRRDKGVRELAEKQFRDKCEELNASEAEIRAATEQATQWLNDARERFAERN